MELFRVGGAVRDQFLGKQSKDIDFTVVMSEFINEDADVAFAALEDTLTAQGFEIFVRTPEFFTLRARFPRDHAQFGRTTADFVMARKEGGYSDGRHPDWVEVGSLTDDLSRRDFTMNAIALAQDGTVIDPHGGVADIDKRLIRCVGDTEDRFHEDALRALRALRFSICLGFSISPDVFTAMSSRWLPELLREISIERVREELARAFRADTISTLSLIHAIGDEFGRAVFRDGLWLKPSLEGN